MSSLRPLATITLLAAVGVFLYMKINETEPVVPAGASEWSGGELSFGAGVDVGGATATTSAPKYEAGAPPPFSPGAPAATAAVPGDAAPAWTPDPTTTATADPFKGAPTTPSATPDSSPIARTADPTATLPPMPAVPDASGPTEAGTAAAPPFTPSATTTENIASPNAAAAPSNEITPTPPAASMFASVRVAVQGALDRGELAQALLLLSDWYGDPSLTAEESKEVESLLGQLAGSVIYEGPPEHRLEPAYIVQAGETLDSIAAKYDVPAPLLAKINRIAAADALTAGQELKVLRGPFSATVDISDRKLTLMLDRRYAGQFAIDVDPNTTIEEGQWKVDQKLVTPAGAGVYGPVGAPTEDRSLLLANPNVASGQAAIMRGAGSSDPLSAEPAGRAIRFKSSELNDVYDILSVGSRVTIRK